MISGGSKNVSNLILLKDWERILMYTAHYGFPIGNVWGRF